MAYERQEVGLKLGGLAGTIETAISSYRTQVKARNAEEETRFISTAIELGLDEKQQLEFRKEQLRRVGDDPEEARRLKQEISDLKDRAQQAEYVNEYYSQLADLESGASSVDSMISYLKSVLASNPNQTVKSNVRQSLSQMEARRFSLNQNVLNAQNQFALNDRGLEILDKQISRVSNERAKAVLAKDTARASMLELSLTQLNKARTEAEIDRTITSFAVSTVTGAQKAVSLLDAYDEKIASAPEGVPIEVGGKKYDSAKQFWTYTRDSYLADRSPNGLFGRITAESKEAIDVRQSQSALTPDFVREKVSALDQLAGRSGLEAFSDSVNTTRQAVVQYGADVGASKALTTYSTDLDANRALNLIESYGSLGANVDTARSQVILATAKEKQAQVSGILSLADQIRKEDPSVQWDEAIARATAVGGGAVISPQQLASRTETQIAKDFQSGAEGETFGTDPRTTVGSTAAKTAVQSEMAPPTVSPQSNDLSERYGIVGKTVYRKSDNRAFRNEAEFFADSGLNSFQNVSFDTSYVPSSQQTQVQPQQPRPQQQDEFITYKVRSGDTLSGIAKSVLGDATRFRDIASQNNIADPNRISVGQELRIKTQYK